MARYRRLRAAGACGFLREGLMSLLISRRFPRESPQDRLHMVLNGLLIGLWSALRRLGHPTLLHPAVRARASRDDNRLFETIFWDSSHTIRRLRVFTSVVIGLISSMG